MAMNSWYIHAGIALLWQYYVHVHVYTTLLYMCYSVCTISITFDFVFRSVIGEGIIWKQLHPRLTFIPRLRLTVSSHLYNTHTQSRNTSQDINCSMHLECTCLHDINSKVDLETICSVYPAMMKISPKSFLAIVIIFQQDSITNAYM